MITKQQIVDTLSHPLISNDDMQSVCTNGDCGQFAIALSQVFGNTFSIFAVFFEHMFDDELQEQLEQCETIEEEYCVLEDHEGIINHVFVYDGTDFYDVSGEVTIDDMGEYDNHNPEPVIWNLGFPCEELETLIRCNTAYCDSVEYYKKIIQKAKEEVDTTVAMC